VATLLAIGFASLLVGPAIVGPRTVYYGDLTAFEQPRDRLLARAMREGDPIPRWEPGIYGGAPTLAAQEMALLYAPNTLAAWVAPDRARAIGIFLHLVLASLGAYALARQLGASQEAALLAALAYGSGGAIVSVHTVVVYLRSAAFLPWILLAAARESTALATVGFLGTYLAGDPFGCVIAAVATLAVRPSRAIAKGAFLALLLGAAQLAPALAVLDEGQRTEGYGFEHAMTWSLWPPELGGLVVPFLFGARAHLETIWITLVTPDQRDGWYEALYVGPVAFALAIAGIQRRTPLGRAGLLLLPFALLALGRFTPLGHVLYLARSFRFPAKLYMPAALGLALLAASGLDRLPRRALAFGLGALGLALLVGLRVASGDVHLDTSSAPWIDGDRVMGALALRIAHALAFAAGGAAIAARGKRARLGLLVLVALDLAIALRTAIPTAPTAVLDREPACAATLRELERTENVPARVLSTDAARVPTKGEADVADLESFSPANNAQGLTPDGGMGNGVRDQAGFLSNEPIRAVKLAERVTLAVRAGLAPGVADALRGARFVLARPGEDRGEPVAEIEGRALLRVRRATPWAAVYPRVRFVSGRDEALAAIDERALDEPIIEGVGASIDKPPRVAKLVSGFGRHGFELEAEGPGWLVVHEAFARGWSARVEGVETPIRPVNVAFRGVYLGEGTKRVVFEFFAPGARLGALMSSLTAVVFLATAARRRWAATRNL
jgi:hypothetical protein